LFKPTSIGMGHFGASARHTQLCELFQHLVQAPLLASIHWIEEPVAVFNPNRHHHFERAAFRGMQGLVEWRNLVLRWALFLRKDPFSEPLQVGMGFVAQVTAWGKASIAVFVSPAQLDIESDHYPLALTDFEVRPHFAANRVLSNNLFQLLDLITIHR
jgi:hypothetical protein